MMTDKTMVEDAIRTALSRRHRHIEVPDWVNRRHDDKQEARYISTQKLTPLQLLGMSIGINIILILLLVVVLAMNSWVVEAMVR